MDEGLRIDKWLWYARFFKSRALATRMVSSGKLRINGEHVSKPHRHVHPDMVLVFPQGNIIRTIKIVALADRRGPATEAISLYEDLDPPQPKVKDDNQFIIPQFETRAAGSGRPTKRDRRLNDALKSQDL
ncbi:MAG: RNA-binding S4 domain-containing protein [Candidatus Puniceispirillaceae bacterium]